MGTQKFYADIELVNASIVGAGQCIISGIADEVLLSVRGIPGSASNLVEFSSDDVNLFSLPEEVGGEAIWGIDTSSFFGTNDDIRIKVRHAAAGSANMQEWQHAASGILARVKYDGGIECQGIALSGFRGEDFAAGTALTDAVNVDQMNTGLSGVLLDIPGDLNLNGNILYGDTISAGELFLRSTTDVTHGNIVMGYNSGLFYDDATSRVGIGTAAPAHQLHVTGRTFIDAILDEVLLTVTGVAGSSSNLVEFIDGNAVKLFELPENVSGDSVWRINTSLFIGDTDSVKIKARRTSSGSANIQEWQADNTGVLARVKYGGGIECQGIALSGLRGEDFAAGTALTDAVNVDQMNIGLSGVLLDIPGDLNLNGNILYGDTVSDGNLIFRSTTNAGHGDIIMGYNSGLVYDDGTNRVGIRTQAPAHPLHVTGRTFIEASADEVLLTVTGIAGSSSNLVEFIDGNTVTLFELPEDAAGDAIWRINTSLFLGSTDDVRIKARRTGSGTADIQEWQADNTGILARVKYGGGIECQGIALSGFRGEDFAVGTELTDAVNVDQMNTAISGQIPTLQADLNLNGNILYGDTISAGELFLRSTTDVTHGNIIMGYNSGLFYDDATSRVGVGTAAPASQLHVAGQTAIDGVTDEVLLTVTGVAGSSSNLVEFIDGNAVKLFELPEDVAGETVWAVDTSLFSGTNDDVRIKARRTGSGSANIQEWQADNTGILARVKYGGGVECQGIALSGFRGEDFAAGTALTDAVNVDQMNIAVSGVTFDVQSDLNLNGNILYGDTASDGNLVMRSTTNAGHGDVIMGYNSGLVYDDGTNRVGVRTQAPAHALHVTGRVAIDAESDELLLRVTGIAGSSSNLVEFIDGSTNTLFELPESISSDAIWRINTSLFLGNTDDVRIKARRTSSGSANIQEWQHNDSSILTRVKYDGGIECPNLKVDGPCIISGVANEVQLTVIGAPASSANLVEFIDGNAVKLFELPEDETGEAIWRIDSSLFLGNNDDVKIKVRRTGGGNANMQEWQNESSTAIARVKFDGGIECKGVDIVNSRGERFAAGTALTDAVNVDQMNTAVSGVSGPIDVQDDLNLNGNILYGDTTSGGDLLMRSTEHSTRGSISMGYNSGIYYDDVNDRVGIGDQSPTHLLHLNGALNNVNDVLRIEGKESFGAGGAIVFGDLTGGTTRRVYIDEEVDDKLRINCWNGLRITGEAGHLIGLGDIGSSGATAKVHIIQGGTTDAIPVLTLEQDDIDMEFMEFSGTSAADGSRSLSSDIGSDGAVGGKIRISINGITKWLRFYDDET